ncbi:MAG: hypothetical protein SCG82_05790 [Candidatus Nitrotoga sp.]|nr:hypothetical protein [Candidatus Nitrotoga sp.]MDW7604031.1 hypothetical protein [Candidatus Nitrotoga sp.]MDW7613059.1 hypothetical protein [Candidatus Nitrotoga sp.]MDW7626173.1 hypothetical protein [Candidatus Nitrotoga sp.]
MANKLRWFVKQQTYTEECHLFSNATKMAHAPSAARIFLRTPNP